MADPRYAKDPAYQAAVKAKIANSERYNMYWLIALQKLYEAEQYEHTAVLKTFVNNSVGVADHDNFVYTLK